MTVSGLGIPVKRPVALWVICERLPCMTDGA